MRTTVDDIEPQPDLGFIQNIPQFRTLLFTSFIVVVYKHHEYTKIFPYFFFMHLKQIAFFFYAAMHLLFAAISKHRAWQRV